MYIFIAMRGGKRISWDMRNRDRMNKMKDIHSMRRIDRKIAGSNPDTEI